MRNMGPALEDIPAAVAHGLFHAPALAANTNPDVVGALDAPVPYSPPLEDYFLPSVERIERTARLLAEY